MINAFKHAFVGAGRPGLLVVAYRAVEMSWRLTVSDNGIGTPRANWKRPRQLAGLGTIIVEALAKQLDARVDIVRGPHGTAVTTTHGSPDRGWLPLTGAARRWPPKSNGGFVAAV